MKKIIILLVVIISTIEFINAQTSIKSNDTTFLYKIIVLDGYNLSFSKNSIRTDSIGLIVNGPLTNNYGEIVGGYIYRGHQIKPFISPTIGKTTNKPNGIDNNFNGHNSVYGSSDNGIFGQTKSEKMVLVPYYDWKQNKENYDFDWAFQNGRMLVVNGKNIHNGSSPNKLPYRSGLGFLPDGRLVYIMVTKGDMNFWEFANMFIEQKCTNAIYLDGNVSLCGWTKEDFDHSWLEDSFGLKGDAMKIHFSR